MSNSTKITLKRSTITVENLASDSTQVLNFGEPLVIDSNEDYLVIGASGNTDIPNSIFFRGMTKEQAACQVTYVGDSSDPDYRVITDLNIQENGKGNYLKVKMVNTDNINAITGSATDKYYILCQDPDTGMLKKFTLKDSSDNDVGIYIDGRGVMHGAAWNDYAENRHFEGATDIDELNGRVVCEDGKGNLVLSEERLQPCSYVVSDNYGMTIGEGNVHVAVAGKCLVCIDEDVELGDCVTAGENGKAARMSRPEIINYPDRILGIVIEVPEDVDGKVWIRVK